MPDIAESGAMPVPVMDGCGSNGVAENWTT